MNENFYFNGELMPSGAQAWHWAGLLPLARKEMQEWDEGGDPCHVAISVLQ